MKHLLFAFILIFPLAAVAQSSFQKQKLDDYLSLMEKHNQAVVAVAISKGNQIIYENGNGYLSSLKNSRITPRTKFKIGSITKTFTATIIFQLIDEGKLNTETKLSVFFPDFTNSSKITIEQLLGHRSGIHNYTDDPDFTDYAKKAISKENLLAMMKRMPSDFEPGSKTSYSNSAYVMLGFIIEKSTGKTYTQNLKSRIFNKLKLRDTSYGDKIELDKNEAKSLIFQGGSWIDYPLEWDMSVPFSAGAIVSNPSDLNEFMYALFNGQLVSEKSITKMKEIQNGLGHGIFAVPFNDKKGFGHSGRIDNFNTGSYYFAEDDINVTVLSSGTSMLFNDLLIGVLSMTFGKPFDFPNFDQKAIELDAKTLQLYEGTFSSAQFPLKIVLKVNGNQLTAQATGQGAFPLFPTSLSEFRYSPAGIVMKFETNGDKVNYGVFMFNQGGGKFLFKKD